MSNLPCLFVEVASRNGASFSTTTKGDVCFRTSQSNQQMLFGVSGNSNPTFSIDTSNFIVFGNLGVGSGSNPPSSAFEVKRGNAFFESNVYVMNKLGVGTTTPTEMIDVTTGNIKGSSNLYIVGSASIGMTSSNPTETVEVGSNLKVMSNIYAMNAVSIGSSNPTEKLQVVGNTKVTNNLYAMNAVSIGTSNPAASLDVQGSAIIRQTANVYGRVGVASSNNPTENLDVFGNTKISGNIYSLQNISIGTSNPTENFDVVLNAKVRSNIYALNSLCVGASNPLQQLDVRGNTRCTGSVFINSNVVIGLNSSNPTERLDVTGNAKVSSNVYVLNRLGVAHSNPTERVDVIGNIMSSSNIYALNNIGAGTVFPSERIEALGNLKVSSNVYAINSLSVGTSNPEEKLFVVGNEKITQDLYVVGGSIAVGHSNPSEKVDVIGNVKVSGSIYANNNLALGTIVTPTEQLDTQSNIKVGSNAYVMNALGVGTSNLTETVDVVGNTKIRSNLYVLSNLAIANSNPTERLDIAGNAKVSNNLFTLNRLGVADSNPTEPLDVVGNTKLRSNVYILSNLSVAHSNPTERLDVTGNAKISNNLYTLNRLGVADSNPTEPLDVVGHTKLRSNVYILSNLSIAHSNPTERLDITGNVKVSNNLYTLNRLCVADSNPTETLDVVGNTKLRSNVYILSNLSIAHSNPTERIDVNGNIKASNNIYALNRLSVANSNPTEALDITGNIKASSNIYAINRLSVALSNPTEPLDIVGNSKLRSNVYILSNLSIGHSNPTERVDVSGNIKASSNVYAMMRFGVANSNPTEAIDVTGNTKISNNLYALQGLSVAFSNPTEAVDVAGNVKLRSNVYILSNLGVGLSNPTFTAHISGSLFASGYCNLLLDSYTSTSVSNASTANAVKQVADIAISTSNALYLASGGGGGLLSVSLYASNTATDASNVAYNTSNNIFPSLSNTSNTINTRVTGFSNNIYASLSNTSNTIFTHLATTNTSLSNTSNIAVWSSNNLTKKSGDTMTGSLVITTSTPSLVANGAIVVRNGNYSNVFSSNQLQLSWSNTSNYAHAINTRHNSNANDTNNSFDFYVWQTSQASNIVGNKHVLSITSSGTGIGTTAPTQSLHVVGKVYSDTQFINTINDTSNVPGFSWAENSNTGMYRHASNVIGFTTGGALRAVIDNSGNIGIGTSNPSVRLDVNGTINATTYQGTTITNISNMALNGSNTANWTSNNMVNQAGDTMTGALNIITSLPNVTLSNSSGQANFGIASSSGQFSSSANAGDTVIRAATTGTRVFVQTGTGASALCINSNNAIGINITTPVETFHVNGKIYGSNQILSSASNDQSNVPSFSWREDSNTGMYHGGTGTIGFATAGAPRMVINSSGNVGIGTSNPSTILAVNGTDNSMSGPHMNFTTTADTHPVLQVLPYQHNNVNVSFDAYWNGTNWISSTASGNFQINKSANQFVIYHCSNVASNATLAWSNAVAVTSGGNVGIGTISPAVKLDVNGTINATAYQGTTITNISNMALFGSNTAFSASNTATWSSNNLLNKAGGTMTGALNFQASLPMITLSNGGGYGDFFLANTVGAGSTNTNVGDVVLRALTTGRRMMLQNGNTTSAICINSNNTVGINNDFPVERFHVNGKIYGSNQILSSASNDQSNVPSFSWREDSNTGIYHAGTGTIGFSTTGVPRMVINSSGNVGIGTSNPSTTLVVNGTDNSISGPHMNFTTTADTHPLLQMLPYQHNNVNVIFDAYWNGTNYVSSTASGNFSISKGPNQLLINHCSNVASNATVTWSNAFTVTSGGNVGIGTLTPAFKLDVNGESRVNGTLILNGGTTTYSSNLIDSNNRTNTYIVFNEAGTVNDYALLRQLGGNNAIQLTLDFHDDGTDASFLIRDVTSTSNPDTIATRFAVDRGGNVGVGMSNPAYKLDVSGDINFTGTLRSNGIAFSGGGSATHWSNNSSNVYVSGGSNVGIGTSTPAQQLHISQATVGSAAVMRISASNNTLNGDVGIVGTPNNFFNNTLLGDFIIRNTTGCNIHLGSGLTSPTMTLGGNTNVGIGTTSPNAKLQITPYNSGSPDSNGLYIYNPTTTTSGHSIMCARVNTSSGGNPWVSFDVSGVSGWAMGIDNQDSQKLKITSSWDFVTSTSTRLTIDKSNGNVGIGTTTPGYKLDVSGGIQANNCRLAVQGSIDGTSARGIYMWDLTDTNWGIYVATSNASKSLGNANTCGFGTVTAYALRFRVFNASTNGFIFENSSETALFGVRASDGRTYVAGDLGVGTATPSEKLHVIGKILASDDITAFSDRRLKSNITPIADGLNKVLKLTGYTFNRNDEVSSSTKKHTGLIAQEVLEVLPEAVHIHDDGMYSVAYGNMAGLFVEAIKQQNEKIKDMEIQLAAVQAQLNSLLTNYHLHA